MKKSEKCKAMHKASYDINIAKDRLNRAVQTLESEGLFADAETLARMILRIEMFETKYEEYRL